VAASSGDLAQLQAFLQSQTTTLPPAVWASFLTHWQPFRAKRKTVLTAAGERERYLYFVLEGIQRIYYLTDDGAREATLVFTYAPSMSGVADAFLTHHPSIFFFETLTPSRFLRLPYSRYLELGNKHPAVLRLMLEMIGEGLRGVLFRQAELQTAGAEAKFLALLDRSPHVLNLIPHKYLASYLGIDPTTFSKLLGKVRIG
jgi:CRP-like cAMP-binding protein